MNTNQITVNQAIIEAPSVCSTLLALAAQHRQQHTAIDQYQTIRHWQPDAGTYCYQTHIAISGQAAQRLDWLADIFYHAAILSGQPWYPQFIGGKNQALTRVPAQGIEQHQLAWACFDLGLAAPRYYRQLLSLARPSENCVVIAARSVDEGPQLPIDTALAYTLNPNGEVLFWDKGCLHWHHICCTPGAAILPEKLDRWLINSLRLLRLDIAERNTYQQEAEQLRDWLQSTHPEHTINFS